MPLPLHGITGFDLTLIGDNGSLAKATWPRLQQILQPILCMVAAAFDLSKEICVLTPLVILGAGGHGRDVLDIVDAINEAAPTYDMLGFLVDSAYGSPGELVNDKPILGDFSWLERYSDVRVVCGVGSSALRWQMAQRAARAGVKFATLIHPTVLLTRRVTIGTGTMMLCRSSFSSQIHIGDHVLISAHCTIGHDVIIEDYVSISPGVHVSGNVHLKEGAEVGTGSNLIQKLTVGEWCILGAGSTVVRDIPANATAVGVPARVIKERPAGWHL